MEFHEGALVTLGVVAATALIGAGRALQQVSNLVDAKKKAEDRITALEQHDSDPSRNRSPDWESEVRRRLTSIESAVETIRVKATEDGAGIMKILGDIRVEIAKGKL